MRRSRKGALLDSSNMPSGACWNFPRAGTESTGLSDIWPSNRRFRGITIGIILKVMELVFIGVALLFVVATIIIGAWRSSRKGKRIKAGS